MKTKSTTKVCEIVCKIVSTPFDDCVDSCHGDTITAFERDKALDQAVRWFKKSFNEMVPKDKGLRHSVIIAHKEIGKDGDA